MIIAVTCENGEIFQHFGRTPQFKTYEVADDKVISSKTIDTNHFFQATFLRLEKPPVIIMTP